MFKNIELGNKTILQNDEFDSYTFLYEISHLTYWFSWIFLIRPVQRSLNKILYESFDL